MNYRFFRAIVGCALGTLMFWELPTGAFLAQENASQQSDFAKGASVAVTPSQLFRSLTVVAQTREWKPQTNDETSRGPAAVLYPKVAPAVVVIRTLVGHGTGFLIDGEGWILSNQHVVEGGDIALPSGALKVTVHLGRLEDGLMVLDEREIDAVVYKTDPVTDLALVKLTSKPKSADTLQSVLLAEKSATPGSDCVAIGHPAAGLLWTVRSGEVSGVGTFPRDMTDTVSARLGLSSFGRQLAKLFDSTPQRKVLVSTCAINPGDSGGPLVNVRGELIGVTFAIPLGDPALGVGLDKFTYHVHLDEVRKFIRERPRNPPTHVPDSWPIALVSALADYDRDGKPDTWVFAMRPDQPATGYLLDLDQDTSPVFAKRYLDDPEIRDSWNFEFSFQQFPLSRTFYDTDNDGWLDLIMTDTNRDGRAELVLEQKKGKWAPASATGKPMFDATLFRDLRLRTRFARLTAAQPKTPVPVKQ